MKAVIGAWMLGVMASGTMFARTTVTVEADRPLETISPYLFGVNHRYAHSGYGMYDPVRQRVRPDFLEKSRGTVAVVRWPGGTIANTVKWKEMIGPFEGRKLQRLGNIQRMPDFPYYGIDEHMAYCEAIGAKCEIMMPFASQRAADAADLVEYLNSPNDGKNPNGGVDWAAERAKNGHPEPYGVEIFEIGNEMHDKNQRYWMNLPSAEGNDKPFVEKYFQGDTVRRRNGETETHDGFTAFARAMKAVDPSIRVFSCLQEVWNFPAAAKVCDGVVLHEYRPFAACKTRGEVYDEWIRRADGMSRTVVRSWRNAQAKSPHKPAHTVVTEFGIIPVPAVWTPKDALWKRDEARTMGRALNFASIVIACAEAQMEVAFHQAFTAYSFGGGPGLGSADTIFNSMFAFDPADNEKTIASATALAYKMFEPFHAAARLAVSVTDNPTFTAARGDTFEDFRALACRTKDGRTVALVINRDPAAAREIQFDFRNHAPSGEVKICELHSPDGNSCNTPAHPETVAISTRTQKLESKDQPLTLTVPPHAIVTVAF